MRAEVRLLSLKYWTFSPYISCIKSTLVSKYNEGRLSRCAVFWLLRNCMIRKGVYLLSFWYFTFSDKQPLSIYLVLIFSGVWVYYLTLKMSICVGLKLSDCFETFFPLKNTSGFQQWTVTRNKLPRKLEQLLDIIRCTNSSKDKWCSVRFNRIMTP